MEYPYVDYYKSPIDDKWHVVEHYGPNSRGTYTCKILAKTKTEATAKSYCKSFGIKAKRRR